MRQVGLPFHDIHTLAKHFDRHIQRGLNMPHAQLQVVHAPDGKHMRHAMLCDVDLDTNEGLIFYNEQFGDEEALLVPLSELRTVYLA